MLACETGTISGGSGPLRPGVADTARTVTRRVVFGEPFSPDNGAVALAAFTPDLATSESGGECSIRKLSAGSSAAIVTASFPNRTTAR